MLRGKKRDLSAAVLDNCGVNTGAMREETKEPCRTLRLPNIGGFCIPNQALPSKKGFTPS